MKRFTRLIMMLMTLFLPWYAASSAQGQTAPQTRTQVPFDRAQASGAPTLGEPADLDPQAPPSRQPGGTAPRDEVLPPPGRTIMHPPQGGQGLAAPKLASPSLEEGDLPLPINLAAALKLADARPLVVAAAQASAWAAEAELAHAKVLWIPTLTLGADYYHHNGFGPDLNHGINTAAAPLNQNVNFLYAGGGFIQMNQTTDMIFTPLAARQTLRSRQFDIQTAKNDALLSAAMAYFEIHRQRGKYAGALDVVQRGDALVKRLESQVKDLIPRVEVNRAVQTLADFQQQAVMAREQWRVQSAFFTQVLRLDPRTVVVPLEPDHLQITLINPDRKLDVLMPIGLTNRPELASQQALVQAVIERIRMEKYRPLLPSLLFNGFQTPNEYLQFGAMGIGGGNSINLWDFRDDISVQPYWQLDSMYLGNLAKIKEQRAMQSLQLVQLLNVQDSVAGQITRAQARLQSAATRVVQADRSLREAIITYDGNYRGLLETKRFGKEEILNQVYRPQEAVVALEHLKSSYDEYFGTIADYNQAQFEMFHALGYPASDLSMLRSPGEPSAVDPSRPDYLPPVQNGPPPATR